MEKISAAIPITWWQILFMLVCFQGGNVCGENRLREELYSHPSVFRIHSASSVQQGRIGTGLKIEVEGQGYIITNNHVVDGVLRVWVGHPSKREMVPTEITGRDPTLDLALLSVPEDFRSVPPVEFGSSEEMSIGSEVYAVGYPFGIRSLTVGYINSTERIGALYLLTQAPLNQGNSGGGLFNSDKRIIGINTAYRSEGNLFGYAVPVEFVQRALPRLTKERVVKHASPRMLFANSWDVMPIFFEHHGFSYPPPRVGVVVMGHQDTVAEQSGIQVGDLITHIDGVETPDTITFHILLLFKYQPGITVRMTLLRRTSTLEIPLILQEMIGKKRTQEK